eukprot:gene23127-29966_t
MFDVTSRVSYRSTPFWYRDLTRASGDIPIVLCCNKIESTDRKVKASVIKYHHKINVPLCEMSVKANYNVEQPLLFLARKLLHKDDLVFVAGPALGPPEVWRTEEDLTRQGRELELALNTPFPTEREEEEDIDMDAELKDLRWFSVANFWSARQYLPESNVASPSSSDDNSATTITTTTTLSSAGLGSLQNLFHPNHKYAMTLGCDPNPVQVLPPLHHVISSLSFELASPDGCWWRYWTGLEEEDVAGSLMEYRPMGIDSHFMLPGSSSSSSSSSLRNMMRKSVNTSDSTSESDEMLENIIMTIIESIYLSVCNTRPAVAGQVRSGR